MATDLPELLAELPPLEPVGAWDAVGESPWVPDPAQASGLSGEAVLTVLEEQRALRRMMDTSRLVLALRLVETYEGMTGTAAIRDGRPAPDESPARRVRRIALAGEGAPLVHEHAPLELASALGMSPAAGRALMGAVIELAHRLPLLWAAVTSGVVDAWRAREVARETLRLSPEVASAVDELVTETPRAINAATAGDLVLEALLALDPDEAARREAQHGDGRAVVITPPTGPAAVPGLPARWTEAYARLDAPDGAALDATLDCVARILAADPALAATPHQQLRSTALGLLADPHAAAALLDGADTGERRPPATLYVHCDAADLVALVEGGVDHGARMETYGPATLGLVAQWLQRRDVRLTPVLDLADDTVAAGYSPPARMQEQVVLRDRSCGAPHCGRSARRCDLDHVRPWVTGGGGGPTTASNLWPLCRPHHRLKTHAPERFARLFHPLRL